MTRTEADQVADEHGLDFPEHSVQVDHEPDVPDSYEPYCLDCGWVHGDPEA